VLALSFSRAAVGELRRRLRASGSDARAIRPVTFDSFATRVLAQVDPDGPWTEQTYDDRIASARTNLGRFAEFLEDIEHVVVDEVQDLVSVRMHFVRELLESLNVGFTLLGDPAQGIYDFSLAEGESPELDGSAALFKWMRASVDGLAERHLTVNHRARSSLAIEACKLGFEVSTNPAEAGLALAELLEDAPKVPNPEFLQNKAKLGDRTAILCRNNGQVLWVSRALSEAGVDHVVQRGTADRCLAPWIARAAVAIGGGVASKAKMTRVLGDLRSSTRTHDVPEVSEVWGPLRSVARTGTDVNLDRLVQRMKSGGLPDELYSQPGSSLLVSTVHRSKGLEFERVAVVPEGWAERPFSDESAKTLFVALSRTIDQLVQVDLPKITIKLTPDKTNKRWLHIAPRNRRAGIEVGQSDVAVDEPFGAASSAQIQLRLWEEMHVGDPASLIFDRVLIGQPGAIYKVVWADQEVGKVSEAFRNDLLWTIKWGSKWKYPKRITGLRIDGVRSVGGDPLVTNQAGLGTGGAWLVPSLVGMGKFEFDSKAEVPS